MTTDRICESSLLGCSDVRVVDVTDENVVCDELSRASPRRAGVADDVSRCNCKTMTAHFPYENPCSLLGTQRP